MAIFPVGFPCSLQKLKNPDPHEWQQSASASSTTFSQDARFAMKTFMALSLNKRGFQGRSETDVCGSERR